ncbi:uncharacterized protein [Nicotiana tomentosiformis]|uniref:uncharacterized protein n=1 Tax=Nicotiana tomentosiformis TaxID=4098 RepID=UPI00388C796B
MLTICSHYGYALIDPGTTLSCITPFVAGKFGIVPEILSDPFAVSTPVAESIIARRLYQGYTVSVRSHQTSADLVELEMLDFDAIMGMDWLAACYATIDCRAKIARFHFPGEPVLEWLVDSGNGGVVLQNTTKSSLIAEVKESQYEDPELVELRERVPQQKKLLLKLKGDGVLRYRGHLCVPDVAGLRDRIMSEAHYSWYSIYLGSTKMYHDIKDVYWWSDMKKNIAEYVAQCPSCQQVKIEHQKLGGLMQTIEIPT